MTHEGGRRRLPSQSISERDLEQDAPESSSFRRGMAENGSSIFFGGGDGVEEGDAQTLKHKLLPHLMTNVCILRQRRERRDNIFFLVFFLFPASFSDVRRGEIE